MILRSPAGKEIWFHLLATAMTASDLSNMARLRGAEEAFTCGILHDFGKLVFLRADYRCYAAVMERAEVEDSKVSLIEREVYGFDHAELGGAAAEAWNLPSPICDLIRFHHDPSNMAAGIVNSQIINLADNLVNLKTQNKDIENLLDSETIFSFGFSVEKLNAIWEDVLVRMDEVMAAFA